MFRFLLRCLLAAACTVLTPAAGVIGAVKETYAYDGLSRITSSTDYLAGDASPQTATRMYDAFGRVWQEAQSNQPGGASPRVFSAVFTDDNRRVSCTFPRGTRTVTATHDANDRITSVSEGGGSAIWTSTWVGPGYRELRRANGNGTTLDLGQADSYDAIRRLTRLRVNDGSADFVDREYSYNNVNLRTEEIRHDADGLTDKYVYDGLYRLTRTEFDRDGLMGATPRTLYERAYDYDGVGSRREVLETEQVGGVPQAAVRTDYSVNEVNEYTAIGPPGMPAARTHSTNGNLVDDGARLYAYDYKNRLVEVREAGTSALIASYRYDTFGRRTEKTVGSTSTTTLYTYDGLQVCEERDGTSGTIEAEYIYSPVYIDEPVQVIRMPGDMLLEETRYVHQNARCDVVAVTDEAGAVVERTVYDDFGFAASPPAEQPYGFQGRRYDPETGLYWFRNRTYDRSLGRFLQRDPVWDAANVGGWFTFGGNSPVAMRDPIGLQQSGPSARETFLRLREVRLEMEQLRKSRKGDVWYNKVFGTGDLNDRQYDLGMEKATLLKSLSDIRRANSSITGSATFVFIAEPALDNVSVIARGKTFSGDQVPLSDRALIIGANALGMYSTCKFSPATPSSRPKPTPDVAVTKEAVELRTRLRLTNSVPDRTLRRYPDENGPDYIDDLGRTYDQMGSPAMIPRWDSQRENFFRSLYSHTKKADYTVVDLTDFPDHIKSDVSAYISMLSEAQQGMIIRIGF